ncbi:unnamed protein product, partial [Coccothraustes coccothraustes]
AGSARSGMSGKPQVRRRRAGGLTGTGGSAESLWPRAGTPAEGEKREAAVEAENIKQLKPLPGLSENPSAVGLLNVEEQRVPITTST